jgi:hypothetical protein
MKCRKFGYMLIDVKFCGQIIGGLLARIWSQKKNVNPCTVLRRSQLKLEVKIISTL